MRGEPGGKDRGRAMAGVSRDDPAAAALGGNALSGRAAGFALFLAATVPLMWEPLRRLAAFALGYNELYSHIILIPVVSCYLLVSGRRRVFSSVRYSFAAGGAVILSGLVVRFLAAAHPGPGPDGGLPAMALSAVMLWAGGFVLFFGWPAARKAAFPLLFLLFMVPIPKAAAEGVIGALQRGSTEVADGLFAMTGVPYIREGFTFHLSSLSVEVAEQCSGIRSSLALFITSVLAGHLFLRTGWKKAALALSIFPITIFKNGLRVVTLSLLGAYVDPAILSSALHKRGGIPFFILALALWAPVLWLLRRSEGRGPDPGEPCR